MRISDIRTSTIAAFLALVAADVIMKFGGFRRLHETVKRWPVAGKKIDDPELIEALCAAVERAGRYYPKQALCLQRSAVGTCLLRVQGIAAQMVIGCRKIPFKGHAWIEVNGQVVNDNPKVQVFYKELDRC